MSLKTRSGRCYSRGRAPAWRSAAVGAGVEQVADVLDAGDLPGGDAELVDLGLVGQLAAQLDDAVVDVDGDRALGDVVRAEELGLDLARERHVVVVAAAGHGRRGALDGALGAARGLAAVDLGEHE